VEETREETVCRCNLLGKFAITLVRISFHDVYYDAAAELHIFPCFNRI